MNERKDLAKRNTTVYCSHKSNGASTIVSTNMFMFQIYTYRMQYHRMESYQATNILSRRATKGFSSRTKTRAIYLSQSTKKQKNSKKKTTLTMIKCVVFFPFFLSFCADFPLISWQCPWCMVILIVCQLKRNRTAINVTYSSAWRRLR